ncbi:MAG TPA: hypothetical protein VNS46_00190 [Nocardioides sp.]|nr:hypothetical protein [Nocardioides sp.]
MEARERRDRGGSLGLLDLIEEHPAAFAYDWRTRFGMPVDDIGESMTYGEAIALVEVLTQDTSSWVFAAHANWSYPASREVLVLADLFDAFAKANFKRPEPYPRPMPDGSHTVERLGERIAPSDIAEVLRGFGREVPEAFLALASQP